jgi:hypothetical protein
MAISSATGLSDSQHRVQLRRAVVAGTVGTIIEAYDFLLYVQVARLVFAKPYFPSSDPLVGTLQAFDISEEPIYGLAESAVPAEASGG